jgi:flagellar motor switch protein FliM
MIWRLEMTEEISEGEVNNFLNASNTEDTGPDDITTDTRKIRIYDFKRSGKFSREQIRNISMIYDTFARLTTTSLSELLSSVIHIHVASVDRLSYGEFIRSIPTPTTLAIINMDPLWNNTVLEIDPAITFTMIDRFLGGPGDGSKVAHELTDIEQSIMEGVIVRILGNLREAWAHVFDLRPRLGQIYTNPQFAQIAPPTEMVVLVTMEASVCNVEGMINFCIPYLTIEPVIGKLSAMYGFTSFENIVTSSKNNTLVNREDMPVKLIAEILRRDYPLGEIKDWKEGSNILPLCPLTPNHCWLRLGDRRVWYCEMMEDEKNYLKKAVIVGLAKMPFGTEDRRMEMSKVTPVVANALEMAKVIVSVELGTTAMTVKEIFGMGEKSIIELDKLAGEPLDVKANGVLIAKGEAVVIDENFGVRITETIGTLNPWAKEETKADVTPPST